MFAGFIRQYKCCYTDWAAIRRCLLTNQNDKMKSYFDYISNNAYIAWTQIGEIAKKYERLLEPIPVLFAGLLNAHNQLGPAEVAAKLKWMIGNTLRKAALLQIPLNPPASHPFNPLLSLRASLIFHPHLSQYPSTIPSVPKAHLSLSAS